MTAPRAPIDVHLDAGNEILTEISAKFSPAEFAEELAAGGFITDAMWPADGD